MDKSNSMDYLMTLEDKKKQNARLYVSLNEEEILQ